MMASRILIDTKSQERPAVNHPTRNLIWHFGGLAAATGGAVMLYGWPAALVVLGVWAVAATMLPSNL